MPEKWDCIYVDRVHSNGRIYLKKSQKYGLTYVSEIDTPNKAKVRKSIPRECGPVKGSSNENKILIATAIANALNRKNLKSSKGLILRFFKGRTSLPGLKTVLIKTQGKSLRVKGSTEWVVYISPKERFYCVTDKRYIGDELTERQNKTIHGCIQYIENEWR